VREFVKKIFKSKKTEPIPTSLSSHKPPTEEGKTSKPNLTPEQQEELNEQFRKAAEDGKTEDVRRLARLGADVNFRTTGDFTALHVAAGWGYIEICRVLKELGADINAKDNTGWTALHHAAQGGRTETCEVLKELGADINAKNGWGQTALHVAARWGNIETCKVLLEFGANPFIKTKNGKTARDITRNPKTRKLLEEYEMFWFGKLIGTEKVNNILDAIKECNPETVREIFVGL